MSTNPIEVAAIPTAIAVLTALQTFFTNLGTDPLQVAAKFPGASAVLIGTVEMQLPSLAGSELGAVQADINTKISGLLDKLKSAAPTVVG